MVNTESNEFFIAQNLEEKISQVPLFFEQLVLKFTKSIPSESTPFLCFSCKREINLDPFDLEFSIRISGKISKQFANSLKIYLSVGESSPSEKLFNLLEISISQAPPPGINLFSRMIVLKIEDVLKTSLSIESSMALQFALAITLKILF